MIYRPDRPDGTNGTRSNCSPAKHQGRVTIPARQGCAVKLDEGDTLRIVNVTGYQVCDFFALISDNPAEFLSMEHCHTALGGIYFQVGDVLITNRRRPILRFVEDTSPGVHDSIIAACDHTRYQELGCTAYHDNCADNFRMALTGLGFSAHHVPAPFNLWMNVPLTPEGRFEWTSPVAQPGDTVAFEALTRCVAVMSACPQDLTAVNGEGNPPAELEFDVSRAA